MLESKLKLVDYTVTLDLITALLMGKFKNNFAVDTVLHSTRLVFRIKLMFQRSWKVVAS